MSSSDKIYPHAHDQSLSVPTLDQTSQGASSRHASHLTLVDMDVEAQADAAGSSKEVQREPEGAATSREEQTPRRRLRRCALPWERKDGWSGYLAESVSTRALIPSLVVQALATGILDATTFADFNTFASNQTGNTILLTVFIIGTVRVLLLLTGVSLASFLGSAFVFGQMGHIFGVRRRAWLFLTTTVQIALLLIACVMVSPAGPAATAVRGKHEWVVIFLFASMSGAQVASARQSACQEVPTAPMTSSYVDLMADAHLFKPWSHPDAGPRNRRVMYVFAMVGGGLLGAGVHKSAGSWVVVLLTMIIKIFVLLIMACGRADE